MSGHLRLSALWVMGLVLAVAAGVGEAAVPRLRIEQTKIGNIFSAGEPVQFVIAAPAQGMDKISWSVKDFHGAEVARGEPAAPVPSPLTLKLDRVGYFTLKVSTWSGGQESAAGETTFAIVTDRDFSAVKASPFGVCTHFGQWWNPEIIPLIVRAGLREVRDEQGWSAVERTEGVFSIPPNYETYAKRLAEAKVAFHLGLTYGNPLYDNGDAPHDAEGYNSFARYAAEMIKHYPAGAIPSVEVWNEWNSPGFCRGPAASKPEVYRDLLAATYEQIRKTNPGVKVVGCSTTGLWWGGYFWLERFFKIKESLDLMDALSVHPYNTALAPEYLTESMAKINAMMKDAGGPVRPIWVTEIGYPVNVDPGAVADQVYESLSNRVSEEVQGIYFVRIYVLLLAAGVEKIHWYDFMNDGTDPRNGEHNFGLIRNPSDARGRYTPKPAYVTCAAMTRQLSGATFVRQEVGPPTMRSFLFSREGQEVRVVWTLAPTVLSVRAKQPFTVVDLVGQTSTVTPKDGVATLAIRAGEPAYLVGPIAEVAPGLTIAIPREARAAVGETISIPYQIASALPVAMSGMLEIGAVKQPFTATPGATTQGRLDLPASAEVKSESAACGVRVGELVLDTVPVAVHVEDPVIFEHPPYLKDDSNMAVTLRNSSQKTPHTVTRLRWTAGEAKGEIAPTLALKPGEEATVTVPDVRLAPFAQVPLTVQLELERNQTVTYEGQVGNNPVPKRTATVDGNLNEWAGLPAIDLVKDGQVKMRDYKVAADLGGKIWIAYDDQNFYLAARLTDDVHNQTATEADVWNGDGIQFTVAPALPWEAKTFYEFALSLTKDGPQLYQFSSVKADEWPGLVKDAVCKIVRSGTETLYEAAIPLKGRELLPVGSKEFAFSLLVNDNDGQGRKGWIEWGSGIGEGGKFPARFNPCRLVDNPK